MLFIHWVLLLTIGLALLVPREWNFSAGVIRLGIADLSMVAFVGLWLARRLQIGTLTVRRSSINFLFVAIIVYALIVAIAGWFLKGVNSAHLYFKDLYLFCALPILSLIVFNSSEFSTERFLRRFIVLSFLTYAALASWTILVSTIPVLRAWFIDKWYAERLKVEELGYFDPSGGAGPFREGGEWLIISDLLGGVGHIGWISLFLIPLLIAALDVSRKLVPKPILTTIIVVGIASVLFLMSRTIIAGLVVAIAVVVYLIKSRTLGLIIVALTILFVASASIFDAEFFLTRVFALSGDVRFGIFATAVEQIAANPWGGIGFGNKIAFPFGIREAESDGVDSLYLTLALKLGLGGALLFLILMVLLFSGGLGYLRRADKHSTVDYAFAAAMVAAFTAVILASFFSYPFGAPGFNIWLFTAIGLYCNVVFTRRLV